MRARDIHFSALQPFQRSSTRNTDQSLPVQAVYDTDLSLYQNIVVTLGFGVKIEAGWKEDSWSYNLAELRKGHLSA